MLKLIELSATADATRSRGTRSCTKDCHAGKLRAAPVPSAKVRASSPAGVACPDQTSMPRATAQSIIHSCVPMRKMRRSTVSASVPPARPKRKTGASVATGTSEITSGETVSEVMTHATATACMSVPRFDTTEAIQRNR